MSKKRQDLMRYRAIVRRYGSPKVIFDCNAATIADCVNGVRRLVKHIPSLDLFTYDVYDTSPNCVKHALVQAGETPYYIPAAPTFTYQGVLI